MGRDGDGHPTQPIPFFFFLVCCAMEIFILVFNTHNDYGLEPSAIGSRRNNNERKEDENKKEKVWNAGGNEGLSLTLVFLKKDLLLLLLLLNFRSYFSLPFYFFLS